MKKFEVMFETSVIVTVEAENAEEAQRIAMASEIPTDCLEWTMLDETREAVLPELYSSLKKYE